MRVRTVRRNGVFLLCMAALFAVETAVFGAMAAFSVATLDGGVQRTVALALWLAAWVWTGREICRDVRKALR